MASWPALGAALLRPLRPRRRSGKPPPGVASEAVIWEGDVATVWMEREPMLFERRNAGLGFELVGRPQIRDKRAAGHGSSLVGDECRD